MSIHKSNMYRDNTKCALYTTMKHTHNVLYSKIALGVNRRGRGLFWSILLAFDHRDKALALYMMNENSHTPLPYNSTFMLCATANVWRLVSIRDMGVS